MDPKLHILILEDIPSDADLAKRELNNVIKNYTSQVVETEADFIQALKTFKPDLIISDYLMPNFDGLSALLIRNKKSPLTPFVVLTGSINEDTAVECIKAGADDYVIKEHLRRLGPAVLGAMEKKKIELERLQVKEVLRIERDNLKNIFEAMKDGVYVVDQQYNIQYVNSALKKDFGDNISRKCYEYFLDRTEVCHWCKNTEVFMGKTVQREWFSAISGKTYDLVDTPLMNADGSISKLEIFHDITERKQAEELLEISEKRFRDIAESMSEWIWEIDAAGIYTYSSETAQLILGYETAEIIGKSPFDFMEPAEQERVSAIFAEIRKEKKQFRNLEKWNQTKDGRRICLMTCGIPMLNDEGDLVGYRGVDTDITERKEAEEALRSSEKLNKSITQTAADAIISMDSNGIILSWNNAAEMMFGYSVAEMADKNLESIIPAKYKTGHIAGIKMLREGGKAKLLGNTVEVTAMRKDGTEFPVELSLSTWVAENKNFYTGIIRDITERKKAEEALRSSEQRFKSIIDQATDALFIYNFEGDLVETNQKACEYLGYSRDELLSLNIADISEDISTFVFRKKVMHELQNGLTVILDSTMKNKNGEFHPVEITLGLIKLRDREVILGFARDTTKRKLVEKQIEQALIEAKLANNVKDQFIANISHEIRTPLNGLLGFSDLLRQRYKATITEEDKDIHKYILNSGNRLMRTVDSILNISQLEAGTIEIQPQELNLTSIVTAVFEELKPLANEKNLEFKLTKPKQPGMIFADKYCIHDAILNIVNNALKYTFEGRVDLKLGHKKDQVVLAINDTGIGISKDYQKRIYDPYTQQSEGYTKNYQGIGLGMALAKRYLELNNVKIELNSKEDGGTNFTLIFPKKRGK